MDLLLVRHAESGYNKRQTKHLDSPITKRGVQQARECGQYLKRSFASFEGWTGFVSPFYRTLQTAKIITEQIPCNFVVNWELREWAHRTSGYTRRIVRLPNRKRQFPKFFDGSEPEFKQSYEFRSQFLDRVKALIEYLKDRDGKYILVSHAMVIYTIANVMSGKNEVPVWDKKILNTSVTYFQDGECRYLAKFVNSGKDPREPEVPLF